jgi:ribosomal protein S21
MFKIFRNFKIEKILRKFRRIIDKKNVIKKIGGNF